MRPDFLIRRSWFYFRMGNMILSWPFGFFGNIIVYYELVLKQIPFFGFLHLWSFAIVFGLPYYIVGAYLGIFQIRRQSLMEGVLSAPYSIYEYKMKPFGREKLLGVPASLTNIEIQKATLLLIERIAPDIAKEVDSKRLLKELKMWEGMTETLLAGGEIK